MSNTLIQKLDLILLQAHAMRACSDVLVGLVEEARPLLAQPGAGSSSEAEDLLDKIQDETPNGLKPRPVFGRKLPESADPVVNPHGGA